jgi:hypothetical protein
VGKCTITSTVFAHADIPARGGGQAQQDIWAAKDYFGGHPVVQFKVNSSGGIGLFM